MMDQLETALEARLTAFFADADAQLCTEFEFDGEGFRPRDLVLLSGRDSGAAAASVVALPAPSLTTPARDNDSDA